jgi:four helix bundle protein
MAGWTCVEDIIAYRLSVKLRDEVLALIDSETIPRNYHLRDQIADAARSSPANISEGFDRYRHGEFGYHVGVAKGSLGELKTHLVEIRTRGFINEARLKELMALLIQTRKTTTGLLKHLRSSDAPPPWNDDAED